MHQPPLPLLWTTSKFFFQGSDYFSSFNEDLDQCKKSVLIESYIFELDDLTKPLLEKLKKLSQNGVQVQILVDGFGSYFHIDDIQKFILGSQIEFKVFNPLPSTAGKLAQKRFLFLFNFFRYLRKFNRRNHRKTMLLDERILYTGSLNWTQVHTNPQPPQKAWRDTGCRLEGPGLPLVLEHFHQIWKKSKSLRKLFLIRKQDRLKPMMDFDQIKMNTRFYVRHRSRKHLIHKIQTAQKRIWITNAYFIPEKKLLKQLLQAARRGVDVQIMVPGPTDVPVVNWAFEKTTRAFLKAQVQLFRYQPTMLHAKTLIVDDWCVVGSANLNHRSALHDLEIEVGFSQPEALRCLEGQWDKDLRECIRIDHTTLSIFKRLRSEIAYRLRYLL